MIPDAAYIKQLFIKHANGTCTAAETAMLVSYLQQEGSEELLPLPDEIAETMSGTLPMSKVAAERVLHNILVTGETPVVKREGNTRLRWMGIATAAAALVAAVVWLYRPGTQQPVLSAYTTAKGEVKHLLLPDGSRITLNANTTLQYDSAGWHANKREVWINGEAFFNVAPDAAGRFTVHAGNATQVEVLGTRFNVIATSQQTQVVLNSGKVKVNISRDNNVQEELVLVPGEMVAYQPDNNKLTRQLTDTLQLTSWKDGLHSFRETSLADIAKMMTRQFGVKVSFASADLASLQFTGTTPAGNLDVMLTILEKSLDLKINKHDDQVVITKAK